RWHAPWAASSSATPASTAAPAASPPGAHPPTPPCNTSSPQSADPATATASDSRRDQPPAHRHERATCGMWVRLPMPPRRSPGDDDDLTVVLVDHPARRIGRLQPHAADSVGGQD